MPISSRRDSFAGFASVRGPDIYTRLRPFENWVQDRLDAGAWSFGRVVEARSGAEVRLVDESGRRYSGLNFASQDYLGLCDHAQVRAAVSGAVERFGPHSAGSDPNLGNSLVSERLKSDLGAFLGRPEIVLFPTGWGAAYGVLRSIVRGRDHVVLDRFAHNCLVSGARAATDNVSFFEHGELADAERVLGDLRRRDASNAVLLVTESLFSMDADGPDLAAFSGLCRAYDAYLVVDVAHDLGCSGESGLGAIAHAIGPEDIVLGTFSKTFCSVGGFAATHSRALTYYMRAFGDTNTFSNTLGPPQVAAALAALHVVKSPEGADLRAAPQRTAARFRSDFAAAGLDCIGAPGPILPVRVGDERRGRELCRALAEAGVLVNFVEFPAVPLGDSRLRLQLSPHHEALDSAEIADLIASIGRRKIA